MFLLPPSLPLCHYLSLTGLSRLHLLRETKQAQSEQEPPEGGYTAPGGMFADKSPLHSPLGCMNTCCHT